MERCGARKYDQIFKVGSDAYPVSDRMIMMTRNLHENHFPRAEFQRVQNSRTAEGASDDFRLQRTGVVVQDVFGAHENFDVGVGKVFCGELPEGAGERVSEDLSVNEGTLANEACDLSGRGTVINGVGRIPLVHGATGDDTDPVRHGVGLLLVVGDQQGRRAALLEDGADFHGQEPGRVRCLCPFPWW